MTVPCPDCGGTGDGERYAVDRYADCDRCGGSGDVPACPRCFGDGCASCAQTGADPDYHHATIVEMRRAYARACNGRDRMPR